jgi:hypothetical protein
LSGLYFKLILEKFKAVPQQVLLRVGFASALKNNNSQSFILTSYLKSVKAEPQQMLLTVAKKNRGKAALC